MLKSREVIQMCQLGKATQARAMLVKSLSGLSSNDQRFNKRLLQDLFYVELHLGNTTAALRVLRKRRALGYSRPEQGMDAALHAAMLLARENKAEQARAELLGLMFNPRLQQWHGALKTLFLYVKVEEECQHRIEQALNRLTAAALKKHGIHLERRRNRLDVREQIVMAKEMFGAASRAYSQLLIRSLSAATEQERAEVVQGLRSFSKSERVGFFRTQAKETLRELKRR